MELIDGKKTAQAIRDEIAERVNEIKSKNGKIPHLAVILVGEDGGSQTYVASKVKSCGEVGFQSTKIEYPDSITEKELLDKIVEINQNDDIDGLLVQLPLPKHISETKVLEAISPDKDVDGFHPVSMGRMVAGMPTFLPATPAGIVELLSRYGIETNGKHCVVLGRSHIVGTPVSLLLSRKAKTGNCTVTICHSRTKDIKKFTLQADIIIAAMGVPEFLKADMVKEGVVVIDVGTSRVPDSSKKSGWGLKGDVDFENVAPKCSFITPVPGGVGPMTIAMLLKNTLLAVENR
ncbi:MAG: tetrahydrofolate dehydrogenase/cyclohydrolase catalytic domain-containing protein [Salinivirgaceae bacterium]|nr:tetrahydrofolate dehydrogenase/cyclohydrolase catalytic domain-containing protein [Salinivirgaceae bacterium]MDD4746863.1 tetrahydrofolate dehydrogenase/cyclohydrolase catalytic domain-containing protein [Salinivirgaceae bacterium]MDY0279082.1 tetrahydrofolate dehydrogenase/cyclohydrolase catalytic domain-containing protein [Salinivirgaceae bacterium]